MAKKMEEKKEESVNLNFDVDLQEIPLQEIPKEEPIVPTKNTKRSKQIVDKSGGLNGIHKCKRFTT